MNGNWEITKVGNPYDQYMVHDSNGRLVCQSVEGEANARLIAAAPGMAEALWLCLDTMARHKAAHTVAFERAAQAIKKAVGEAAP